MKKGIRLYKSIDDETPFLEIEARPFDLGEFREMKREFGLADVGSLDLSNPDHIVGMAFVLGRSIDPNLTVEAVERCSRVEIVNDEAQEAGSDPTERPSPTDPSSASSLAQDADGAPAASE